MTVDNISPVKRYPFVGVANYDFGFMTLSETDISVIYLDADGLPTELTTDQYSVTIFEDTVGGRVSVTDSEIPSGEGVLVVSRDIDIAQGTRWVNNNSFDMANLERDFDRVIMILQEMRMLVEEGTIEASWRGDWVTSYEYDIGDLVRSPDGSLLSCAQAHTSDIFTTDLANGNWVVILDMSDYTDILTEVQTLAGQVSDDAADMDAQVLQVINTYNECVLLAASVVQCRTDFLSENTALAEQVAENLAEVNEALSLTEGYAEEAYDNRALAQAAASAASGSAAEANSAANSIAALRTGLTRTLVDSDCEVGAVLYKPSMDTFNDGWIDRSEHTSWFKELGRFPETALVVSSSESVSVYDAQDVDTGVMGAPFISFPTGLAYQGFTPKTCLAVGEGVIVSGCSTGSQGSLQIYDFVNDVLLLVNTLGVRDIKRITDGISGRLEAGLGVVTINDGSALPSNLVNDVAITMLEGLEWPTIAVATDSGVAVVNGPAGKNTIVSSTHTSAFNNVAFTDQGDILAGRDGNAVYVYQDYSSDNFDRTVYFDAYSAPRILSGNNTDIEHGCIATADGVSLLKYNSQDPTSSLVNRITNTSQSGWFDGDTSLSLAGDTTEGAVGIDLTPLLEDDFGGEGEYGWSSQGDWVLANGAASMDGTQTAAKLLYQDIGASIGDWYETVFFASRVDAGIVISAVDSGRWGDDVTAPKVQTDVLRFAGASNMSIQGSSDFDGDVDFYYATPVTQLLSDPYFESGIDDWTDNSSGSSNISWDSGNEAMILTADGINQVIADFPFTTVVGQTYSIKIGVEADTIGLSVGTTQGAADLIGGSSIVVGASSLNSVCFKATGTTTYVRVWKGSVAGTGRINEITISTTNGITNNSTFVADYGWTQETGWSISGGTANYAGGAGYNTYISQQNVLTIGNRYLVTLDVSSLVGTGAIGIYPASGTIVDGVGYTSSNGLVVCQLLADSTDLVIYGEDSLTSASIDSVNLYEMELVNGTWQVAGNAITNPSFEGFVDDAVWNSVEGGNKAQIEASEGSMKLVSSGGEARAYAALTTVVGTVYEVSFQVVNNTTGAAVALRVGSTAGGVDILPQVLLQNGYTTYVFTFKADTTTTYLTVLSGSGSTAGSYSIWDSFSVKPVQNLIENGEFSSDRVWNKQTGWSISGGSAAYDGNGDVDRSLYQGVNNLTDVECLLVVVIDAISSGTLRIDLDGTDIDIGSSAGTYIVPFISDWDSFGVRMSSSSATCMISSMKLYHLDTPDLTGSGNSGRVIGQLTKELVNTGCDLTAFKDFSGEDNIEFEYDSSLDFGTGDFCVSFWNFETDEVNDSVIIDRRVSDNEGLFIANDNTRRIKIASTVSDSTIYPSYGVWEHVVWQRVSGAVQMFINGVKRFEAVNVGDADAPSKLFVGVRYDKSSYCRGSLNLMRVSNGYLTPEQIKFIYDTEKLLFRAGAQGVAFCSNYTSVGYDKVSRKNCIGAANQVLRIDGCTFEDVTPPWNTVPADVNYSSVSLTQTSQLNSVEVSNDTILLSVDDFAFIEQPAFNIRDELANLRKRISDSDPVPYSIDITASDLVKMPTGYKAQSVYVDGTPNTWVNKYDGFNYYSKLGSAQTGTVTGMMIRC